MSDQIVRFSRLLRIFKLNNELAYIIELEYNYQKTIYISYRKNNLLYRCFESYERTKLKDEFKELSDYCLMDQCVDARNMFENSPITHFEANCSSLVYASSMFESSCLYFLNAQFPLLKNSSFMFASTKVKKITIDFPNLKEGHCMFFRSSLEKITSQFPLLEDGRSMFKSTLLKEINCHFPKTEYKTGMFNETPPELKQNYPHYFI